jgi:hypothetical protein
MISLSVSRACNLDGFNKIIKQTITAIPSESHPMPESYEVRLIPALDWHEFTAA